MPHSPSSEHISEEVEDAQREVPGAGGAREAALRPQHLADEADLPVRRQEAGPQERAALRARGQGDQRVAVDLGCGATEERDPFGMRGRRADEVGEEAARDALLDGVPDDRDRTKASVTICAEAAVG